MHLTFQADDTAIRHAVLKEVGQRWGAAARLVLQEFVANAAEHCSDHRVDLDVQPQGLVAMDYGGGCRRVRTRKPHGTGGYGLRLIRRFGGVLSAWDRGLRLEYRFPVTARPSHPRKSSRPHLARHPMPAQAGLREGDPAPAPD